MRDFNLMKDLSGASEKKCERVKEIIDEAFRGVGKIDFGINLFNINNISEQYKKHLFDLCELDCCIFTSAIVDDENKINDLIYFFQNIINRKKSVNFINMLDRYDEEDIEKSCKLIQIFEKHKMGKFLYNMDISTDIYENASYITHLRKNYVQLKENTENIVLDINEFLANYDRLIAEKDSYTAQHSRAVCRISLEIGKKIGLNKIQLKVLTIGAALHDIGKYEIDLEILKNQSKLSYVEFKQIKTHPLIGKTIMNGITFEELIERDNDVIEFIIEQHHERYDGKGYPRKLNHKNMHQYSMIVSVADAFHAMLGRAYQKPKTKKEIIANILESSGTQFHPSYANLLCHMIKSNPESLGLECDSKYLRYVDNMTIDQIFSSIETAIIEKNIDIKKEFELPNLCDPNSLYRFF